MDYIVKSGRGLRYSMLLGALWLAGCHGEMTVAPVSGTVTLDGQPLKAASVLFQPEAGGRPSFGVTNEKGFYRLEYSMQELGAEVGKCRVSISTASTGDDSGAKPTKELVPARYAKTEPIIVTVEPKSNTIDIALTTQ